MKEIGGYIEFPHYVGTEYHMYAQRLNSARYAIEYIVRTKGFKIVHLPRYLCGSVSGALRTAGFTIFPYTITDRWLPDPNLCVPDDEVIIVVNYFGQLSNSNIDALCRRYRNIIVDNTQSFFQKPVPSVDTVYSCRKYFGVPDGAYLYTDDMNGYEGLQQDYSAGRLEFLAGRYEQGAEAFYTAFHKNEEKITQSGPRKMSVFTENLLRSIDYAACIQRRKENFFVLDSHLKRHNHIQIRNQAGLFMYPLLQTDYGGLRTGLIERKIYTPKLWPTLSEPMLSGSKEMYLSENIVWLPMDQRYGTEDMEYIIKNVKEICGWNL